MRLLIFTTLCLALLTITGCQEETPPLSSPEAATAQEKTIEEQQNTATLEQETTPSEEQAASESNPERTPPQPPILEDFQGQPQLSLFPRVGDYQPDPDSERHPYWRTFIDHLVKVTGVAENPEDGSRGWVFRSNNTIDSLGYFAPLAVEPNKNYQVSFKLMIDLGEGASAGIGILEFNEFLWIGEQYTEETFKKHYRGSHEGKRLTGKTGGLQTFNFTTGPDTNMIHIILFREGPHDRNALMFDDIEIK
jgi:hypothetical protein